MFCGVQHYCHMSLAIPAKAGHKRQLEACIGKMSLPAKALKNVVQVAETISGILPIAARSRLTSLIQDPNIKEIHVESCRAVARKSVVAEALFELSTAFNTKIACADYPHLFKHNCSPADFIRKVIMANEFHRDLAVQRLTHGLEEARKRSNRRTQRGLIQVNGHISEANAEAKDERQRLQRRTD